MKLSDLDTGDHQLRAVIAGPEVEASTFECLRCGRAASTPTVFTDEPCRNRHP
jgi:hypothetical protein